MKFKHLETEKITSIDKHVNLFIDFIKNEFYPSLPNKMKQDINKFVPLHDIKEFNYGDSEVEFTFFIFFISLVLKFKDDKIVNFFHARQFNKKIIKKCLIHLKVINEIYES